MATQQDPELRAISTVLKALEPLNGDQRFRVMSYVRDKLHSSLDFSPVDLIKNCTIAFDAINESAEKISSDGSEYVTGMQLIEIVTAMFMEARKTEEV
jgi:hypothetical protein